MAEYIKREDVKSIININFSGLLLAVDLIPAADVSPVVRCKDCIYTRKVYGRLVCKYGTCSGCILREDFFCANGTRKEGDKDA